MKVNKLLIVIGMFLLCNLSYAKEVIDIQLDHPLNMNIESIIKVVGKPATKDKVDNEPGTMNYEFTKDYPHFTIQSFKDHLTIYWEKAGIDAKDVANNNRLQQTLTAIMGDRMYLKVSANLDKPTQLNTPKAKINISPDPKTLLITIRPIK